MIWNYCHKENHKKIPFPIHYFTHCTTKIQKINIFLPWWIQKAIGCIHGSSVQKDTTNKGMHKTTLGFYYIYYIIIIMYCCVPTIKIVPY